MLAMGTEVTVAEEDGTMAERKGTFAYIIDL